MTHQIVKILTVLIVILTGLINIPVALAEPQTITYTEGQLQQGDELTKTAITASRRGDFATAEELWTDLIAKFPTNPAMWSNRGNVKVSENKLEDAIADYNKSIELAPDAPDAYLNRGTVWELQRKWDKAIADYNRVLELNPNDPAAYNNRGNAEAGLGEWEKAISDYRTAFQLVPTYALAHVNYALALYQIGQIEESIRTMRNIIRKYSKFPDARAALTAILWEQGQRGEAESNWVAVVGLDSRYKDINWIKNIRRWPPAMVKALDKFLTLQ